MDFSSSENAENNQEKGSENCQCITETVDPDYVSVTPEKLQNKACLSEQQQDAKDNAVQKIKNIIRKQFAMEIQLKEQEIETIDQRIRQTKASLDRLRACILARYYGMSQDFQEERTLGSRSKTRRSRRECASQSSAKVLSSHGSKQLNSTGSFSGGNLGNMQPKSLIETTTKTPTLEKKSSTLGDYKNPVTNAAINFENSTCSKLGMNDDKAERISLVDNSSVSVSASSSHTGSETEDSFTRDSVSQQQSILTSINSSYSSASNSPSLGSHLREHTYAKGIQSNASEIESSALLGVPTQPMKSQSAVTSSQETSKNEQGSQLTVSSSSKGPHITTAKDVLSQSNALTSGSRFYVKKRVVIGNTSKYIPPERREDNDKSTHKWMVYVRGPPEDPHIDAYIQKVWFFLHPSYRPNDIIEVKKPPFHLTRRGWGEFPIRVQLHFVGTRNKRVDIIHELKLDKTYTGLQTLGAETVVDLEIDRKTFEDLGIPVSWELSQVPSSASDTILKTPSVVNLKLDINSVKNPGIVRLKKEYFYSSTSSEIGQLSTTSATKRPRLDTPMSSIVSTPCGSRISSRCASPILRTTPETLDDGLEEHLHTFAEKIPLISSKKNVVSHPFSAQTVEEYLAWNVGKRRAAEWQRAAKICAQLEKCVEGPIITKKGVMIWCRRFAHTPQENMVINETVEYCKICGKLIEQDTNENLDTRKGSSCSSEECSKVAQVELSSLTPVDEILKEIEEKEKLLNEMQSQKDNEDDADVDVVGCVDTKKPRPSTVSSIAKFTIPLTAEEQWVKNVCNDIGISLRPVTIQDVEVNAVERILLKLSIKFAESILRKASSLNTRDDSSLEPKLVVPAHIYQAIGCLSLCDFLGNSYFGNASEKP